jgi:hypothetical protein
VTGARADLGSADDATTQSAASVQTSKPKGGEE